LGKALRALGYLCAALSAALVVFGIYVARTWDKVYESPLPDVKASTDPAVIARGEYLVYGPAHCIECHGANYDAVQKLGEGQKLPLAGGLRMPVGPLGVVYSKNLTPDPETGIGRYSDGQIARMMRYAIKADGRATIEPMMPFGNMSEDDLAAVISYLRAQTPVRNQVPGNEWTLMGKIVKSVAPVFKPRSSINPPATAPVQGPTKERGEYIARSLSNCVGCHTPRDQTSFAAIGPDFSGGFEMEPLPLAGADPNVWFKSPNLTPAKGSALLKFPDRETFIARFQRGGRHYAGSAMPWESFAQMTNDDISALYEFLHALPPSAGPTGDAAFRKAN
jgi:mono/diheme cytochrome c family protein